MEGLEVREREGRGRRREEREGDRLDGGRAEEGKNA